MVFLDESGKCGLLAAGVRKDGAPEKAPESKARAPRENASSGKKSRFRAELFD